MIVQLGQCDSGSCSSGIRLRKASGRCLGRGIVMNLDVSVVAID